MTLTHRRLSLHYHHEFRIARGGSRGTETLLVELHDDGLVGRGEGVPARFYGWTLEAMEAAVEAIAARLPQVELATALEEATAQAAFAAQPSALAALDGAIWDLRAQRQGRRVVELVAEPPYDGALTSFTIGMASREEMLAKAEEAAQYPILKVKCGSPGDLDNLRALREATGKRLWVDANCGWAVAQAADLAGELATLGVELIEQPVGRDDLDGLARVREVSPLPIVADESCHTPADVDRLVGAVDGVNVKLDKAGGITGGLAVIARARTRGLRVMLGCFCASSVALSMAGHLAPLVDWCDLDGHLLVADDPFEGMTAPGGRITLPQRPGLGVVPRATP